MANLSVSRRYSQALFHTAAKSGTIERVETDLETIDALVRTNPRLLRILRAPTIGPTQKKELVGRLFESQISSLTLRFLDLLIDKRREDVLPEVNREFRALSYAARNILPVTATVADPPQRRRAGAVDGDAGAAHRQEHRALRRSGPRADRRRRPAIGRYDH